MTSAGWHAGIIAFVCVLASAPVVGAICSRWNLFDRPGPLKIHAHPIPRLGGVAIAIGIVVATTIEAHANREMLLWLAAYGIIWLSGFVDDIRGLPPLARLAAQLSSGLVLWLGGWRLPLAVPAWASLALICGVIVLFVNAFNFLDGSDGLAAGATAIIAAAYIALAYIGAGPPRAETLGLIVAWALFGTCTGFLSRNLPPARLFMGDAGSVGLGFCVAFLGIELLSRASGQPNGMRWLFPLLVATVPILDGIVVVLRRVKQGRSAFQGDRFHYYDLLMARGWCARTVALGTYAVTALLAGTGLAVMRGGATAVLIFVALCAAGIFLASVGRTAGESPRPRASQQVEN